MSKVVNKVSWKAHRHELSFRFAFQNSALRFFLSDNALTSCKFDVLASSLIVASRSITDIAALSNSYCLVLAIGHAEFLLLVDKIFSELYESWDQASYAV